LFPPSCRGYPAVVNGGFSNNRCCGFDLF
jgi:hypothetical protein